jgi:glycine betaine/proline transport system substrate-binding protein
MNAPKLLRILAVFFALSLAATACSDSDSDSDEDAISTATTTRTLIGRGANPPGQGITVTMGRAPDTGGHFSAEIYATLLRELGYTVSEPSTFEVSASDAYRAVAQGQMDFWTNSHYPEDLAWHSQELIDGSLVGDHLAIVGEQTAQGALRGLLITKTFADEYAITTLEDLNTNEAALAAFDLLDPLPGNGKADIFGCEPDSTCAKVMDAQLALSGLDSIGRVDGDRALLLEQALAANASGIPMVVYVQAPSAELAELRPGDNVYWVGFGTILDDSNPTGIEGGESLDQRPGTVFVGPHACPSAAQAANGQCPIGFLASDILVTANTGFLAANPAAETLLGQVTLSLMDVSLATAALNTGSDPKTLADQWIADNRSTVDMWVDSALDGG